MEREKIMNGLRCHAGCEQGYDCDTCDYIGHSDCSEILAKDVLALLKEQEAITPIDIERIGGFATGLCPTCGTWINKCDNAKACGRCGQGVKWDD